MCDLPATERRGWRLLIAWHPQAWTPRLVRLAPTASDAGERRTRPAARRLPGEGCRRRAGARRTRGGRRFGILHLGLFERQTARPALLQLTAEASDPTSQNL